MSFFAGTRPGKATSCGQASFELPILYFRDDFFSLLFKADFGRVSALMPSAQLHPVKLLGGKAIVGIGAFNYLETSIGPYGEVAVIVPAVYGPRPPPPMLPALLQGRYPGFGFVVLHLPVTTQAARDAGRGMWGYTKFVADMSFVNTPELLQCRLGEQQQHILTLTVARQGVILRDSVPVVTFSVKDGQLIETVIPQCGVRCDGLGAGSSLQLGDHPVAESIRELGLSARPFMSRYYLQRSAILPAGKVIEQGVRPLEGYSGMDRKGELSVGYLAEEG